MTAQEQATIMLLDHQSERAARMRLAGLRENQLAEYYASERRRGVDPVVACERMSAHAQYLDRNYENDLEIIRECLRRTT